MQISILGPPAVGKTTVIKNLKLVYPEAHIFSRVLNPTRVFNGFCIWDTRFNSKSVMIDFFRELIKLHSKLLTTIKHQFVIFDRGPEDLFFLLYHYNKVHQHEYCLIENLSEELKSLKSLYSDIIIYLSASHKDLLKRKINDRLKQRDHFDKFISILYDYEIKWFMNLNQTHLINTTDLTKYEVTSKVSSIINKYKNDYIKLTKS